VRIGKIIFNISLILNLLFLPSCVTKALWEDYSYEERITQFFVSVDGQYIVLIGENYHYVLTEKSGMLKEILGLKQQGILTINSEKTHLKLDVNNDIAGDAVIEGPASILLLEDLEKLKKLGITPNKEDVLSVKIHIVARRYAAKYLGQNFPAPNAINKLRIDYSDSSAAKNIGKAAITPLTIIIDGVILGGKIVTYPLTIF